jgi:hypothetical protein
MENQSAKRKLHNITYMSRGEAPLFIGGAGAADLGTGLAATALWACTWAGRCRLSRFGRG